jgi:hypothetical protein
MPNDRRASACGTATVVPLRLRSRRLSVSTPLSRSPNRRPKQNKNKATSKRLLLLRTGWKNCQPLTGLKLRAYFV